MMYQIIQPPFTLVFREMSKKELKDYKEWFLKSIPERIQILTSAVKSIPGYEKWEVDYSPKSLESLGEWFHAQVDTRSRTQEEIDNINSRSSFPIDVSDQDLTNKTFSLAMDIGMYLSQVFLKNHASLEWSQPLGGKKFVDYGQPVLLGFGKVPFNPVRMMVTQAYGLVSKNKTGRNLRGLYDYWSKLISVA